MMSQEHVLNDLKEQRARYIDSWYCNICKERRPVGKIFCNVCHYRVRKRPKSASRKKWRLPRIE